MHLEMIDGPLAPREAGTLTADDIDLTRTLLIVDDEGHGELSDCSSVFYQPAPS